MVKGTMLTIARVYGLEDRGNIVIVKLDVQYENAFCPDAEKSPIRLTIQVSHAYPSSECPQFTRKTSENVMSRG
jgi:hypothetical protein